MSFLDLFARPRPRVMLDATPAGPCIAIALGAGLPKLAAGSAVLRATDPERILAIATYAGRRAPTDWLLSGLGETPFDERTLAALVHRLAEAVRAGTLFVATEDLSVRRRRRLLALLERFGCIVTST